MAANVAPQIPPLPKGRFDWEHRGEWIEDPTTIARHACGWHHSGRPQSPVHPSWVALLAALVGIAASIAALGPLQPEDREDPITQYGVQGIDPDLLNNVYGVGVAESTPIAPALGPSQAVPQ